ncbi:MAG TPA: response regulator [Gaiellaceae bacterium]|nr:response regulator [Gaiellaceae bacterium]
MSGVAPAPGGALRRDATILVVDDQPFARDVIRLALEGAGYTVLEAESPSAALGIVRETPRLDLLVADVVMPEMDAFELSELVVRELPGIRVLFTSGYANAAEEGPFIQKPFSPSELVAKVDGLLAGA